MAASLSELSRQMELTTGPKRILVVEDHEGLLHRLRDFLLELGHEVVAVMGIVAIDDAHAVAPSGERFALAGFDGAFLDHYFLSRHYNGTHLTHELVVHECPRIFAMSSDAVANASMRAAGANFSLRKPDLLRLFGLA